GRAAFGELQARAALGQDPYPAPDATARPLVVVALTQAAAAALAPDIREALWRGQPVVLASTEPKLLAAADPRVRAARLTVPGWGSKAARQVDRAAWLALAGPVKAAGVALQAAAHLPAPLHTPAVKANRRVRGALTDVNGWHRGTVQPRIRAAALGAAAGDALAGQILVQARSGGDFLVSRLDGAQLIRALKAACRDSQGEANQVLVD
ncbi:MAG: hypothetical protein LBR19_03620, partial [Bifidobacteriaceae bacterium]|nr:hypothetical protein [Bifidobacteriaceae bacterium]